MAEVRSARKYAMRIRVIIHEKASKTLIA